MKEFFSVFKLDPALFEGETGGRDQSGATQETGATAQAAQCRILQCALLQGQTDGVTDIHFVVAD